MVFGHDDRLLPLSAVNLRGGAAACALACSVGGPGPTKVVMGVADLSPPPTRPHLEELVLSRTLELAAAVLGEGEESIGAVSSRLVRCPEPATLGHRGSPSASVNRTSPQCSVWLSSMPLRGGSQNPMAVRNSPTLLRASRPARSRSEGQARRGSLTGPGTAHRAPARVAPRKPRGVHRWSTNGPHTRAA